MKKKVISSVLSLTLVLSLVLTGCNKPSTPEVSLVTEKKANASGITVADIKKKYGVENDQAVMPMYNVENDKRFVFNFKSDVSVVPVSDPIITVHTDIKCEDASKVLALASTYSEVSRTAPIPEGYKSIVEVVPISAVLASENDMRGDDKVWGNAPTYYIKLSYDMESEEVKKLDKPTIIPFTIKSELPVPNLKYEISPDGRLKLTWDKVEGAEKYNIYNARVLDFSGITDKKLNSAEAGYTGVYPLIQATVTETEWDDFLKDGNHALNSQDGAIVTAQNSFVGGQYFVTALADDTESRFSTPVDTTTLSEQLPYRLEKSNDLFLTQFDNVTELPTKVDVEFIDGTIKQRDVIYDTDNMTNLSDNITISYSISGTALKGYVRVVNFDAEAKDALKSTVTEETSSGYVPPENNTDIVPKPSVPTIITSATEPQSNQEKSKEESISVTNETNNKISQDTTVEEQKVNTRKQVEQGDKEAILVPEVTQDIEVNSSDAFQEFLALNLIDAQSEFSLKSFPEAQNYTYLGDALEQVIYQNPLILGVKAYEYDYTTLGLRIMYDDTPEVIKKKQKEIIIEANKIVASVITPDMSDEQKRKALYDYLDKNTKYDTGALENAEKNNFKTVDAKFNDSFTTYGIMNKKVGVCASYASVYKMLSDLCRVETIVVTGYLGSVPHAWNKVKIDDDWVNVDTTNNGTNSGVPYMIYEANDQTAKDNTYSFGTTFWIDNEIPKFVGKSNKNEYYSINELEVESTEAYQTKLTDMLTAGKNPIIIRFSTEIDQDKVMEATAQAFTAIAKDKLGDAKVGLLGKYILIAY